MSGKHLTHRTTRELLDVVLKALEQHPDYGRGDKLTPVYHAVHALARKRSTEPWPALDGEKK